MTVLNYVLALVAVVLFYLFYTRPDDCTEHKVFISLNLLFCLLVSVIAVLPKVQVSVLSRPPVPLSLTAAPPPGGPAQLRPPPGLRHLPLRHVRHLVGHDQQPQ